MDRFIRPSSNARWDYDEYGYLWADDESLQPQAQDKFALQRKNKKKRGDNKHSTKKKYSQLMTAYGETVNKKDKHVARKKQLHLQQQERIMNLQKHESGQKYTSTPFDPPEMR